jgi:hypothetical protein
MAHDFQRPGLPYDNEALQNDKRYQIITRTNNRPATDVMIDTDFNYLIDAVRQLDVDISGINAGILTGSDIPGNANFLPTTDGAGNISWVDISDENVRDESISASKLIPQTITDNELMDASVVADKIAPNAITTIKILDANITTAKIADGAITEDEIDDNAVTTVKIADANVTTSKIADANVTTVKIADANVTTSKIADANVTTDKILDANVTTSKIVDKAVTADKIADHTITPAQIDPTLLTGAAVKADQKSGTSITTFTNPAVQQFHPSAAKFWCTFDGTLAGTNAPTSGYNVVSVTRSTAGEYIINYITPFTSAEYSVLPSSYSTLTTVTIGVMARTTNSTTIQIFKIANSAGIDQPYVSVVGFGLQ